MIIAVVVIGVIVLAFILAGIFRPAKVEQPVVLSRPTMPYYSRGSLLSRGELAFHRVLVRAVPSGLVLCPKVRLADIATCSDWWNYGARIAQKHVDFVITDADSRLLAVVELDDKSHALPDRKARDLFVDQCLASCGIPVLRVKGAASYDSWDLRQQVERMLGVRTG